MRQLALDLPPVHAYEDGLSLYFLTGKNYLYQTVFCIQSLKQVSGQRFAYIMVDDGSFDDALALQARRMVPDVCLVSSEQVTANLDRRLPWEQFPHLRAKRLHYPQLRKLTDIHTLGDGWKLVLDSDMLFWDTPEAMIDWLRNPCGPVHMVDCTESYGYSKSLMEKLCGTNVPELLNVGIIGLKSEQIDWKALDLWIRELEGREGGSYYLEQALSAMLIGDADAQVLGPDQYIVNPAAENAGVLHHYVDLSKKFYFNKDWKKIYNEALK